MENVKLTINGKEITAPAGKAKRNLYSYPLL